MAAQREAWPQRYQIRVRGWLGQTMCAMRPLGTAGLAAAAQQAVSPHEAMRPAREPCDPGQAAGKPASPWR